MIFGMAIDKIDSQNTSSTMLQIQNVQKSVLSGNIFEDSKTEDTLSSTIHSGHFMVSRVHEEKEDDDDDEETPVFSDDSKDLTVSIGYDFVQANKLTSQTYNFGSNSTQTLSIDADLTKPFQCLTLAYSGKITSPKWKPFRGMHLTVKDKVRLNNIIWREWHMQYIFLKKPIVCQFATPLSDYIHTKPEAVVLEGKYWKRRLDTVTKEYKKWRRYYRDRILQAMPGPVLQSSTQSQAEALSEWDLLERVKDVHVMPFNMPQSSTDLSLLNTDLMDTIDFTDNLFNSLNHPLLFPNPKEFGGLSCADLIQPGLVQLQPNLEDFMDIDSMHELLAGSKQGNSVTTFTAQSACSSGQLFPGLGAITDVSQSQTLPTQSVLGLFDASLFSGNSDNTTGISMLTALAALTNSTSNSTANLGSNSSCSSRITSGTINSDSQMMVDDLLLVSKKQPTFPKSNGLQNHRQILSKSFDVVSENVESAVKQPKKSSASQSLQKQSAKVNFSSLGLTPGSPPMPSVTTPPKTDHTAAPFSPARLGSSCLLPRLNKGDLKGNAAQPASSSDEVGRSVSVVAGKDCFTIPQGKPVTSWRKPRSIAPAPAPSLVDTTSFSTTSSHGTYLAQLLTKGTYPGALISVKKEMVVASATSCCNNSCTPILPVPCTPSNQQQQLTSTSKTRTPLPTSSTKITSDPAIDINKTGIDFPSVLLTATSSVLETSPSLKDVLRLNPVTPSSSDFESNASTKLSPKKNSVPLVLSSCTALPLTSASSPAFSEVISPSTSPSCINMVLSPPFVNRDDSTSLGGVRLGIHTEQRRQAHLSAEQKRRCNLKSGFDLLHTLVPSLAQNPKVSKATMLQKTAEHCRRMKAERAQMQHEAAILKQEIDSLNNSISHVQSQLPETGVPVTRQRVDQMKEMFEDYVKNRTLQNWKFWIFSVVIRSLFDSYSNMVSTASVDELCRSAAAWLDQHCSLVSLRPSVLNALKHLSMSTSILTEPLRVREQATEAVTKGNNSKCSKLESNSGHS